MENQQDWQLENINIHRDWQKVGLYSGNVTFRNGIKMQMSLQLDNNSAVKMITLLQDEIRKSASNLSDLLGKSMPIAITENSENQN